jgi:hypothetical protein
MKKKTQNTPGLRVPAGQALQALQALQKLAVVEIPAMEAFGLSRLIATLNANASVVAADRTRLAIVKKHGVEKDGNFQVPAEGMARFLTEYGPVAATVVTLDVVVPLRAAILEHALAAVPAMSAMDIAALLPFFEEET